MAFHGGVILASYVVLRAMDLRFWRSQTDIRREFRYVRLSAALVKLNEDNDTVSL